MRRLAALAATVAAVVLAILPGVVDARPSAPRFPPVRPTRVLVLGDSVMKGAAPVYATKLPGREVIVDAEVNRSTGQGAEVVAKVGADWDVVVILLGHNDGGSPGAYQPAARRILDQLRGVRRVVWLTIHEVRPYYPGVNQYIASLQQTYPNLRTADWNAVAAANPGALAGDGLHLNGTGAQLMADLVAQQVKLAELEWYGALKAFAPTTTTSTTTTAPPTTTSTTAPTTTTTTAPPTTEAPARDEATASSTEPDAGAPDAGPGDDGPGALVWVGAAAVIAAIAGLVVVRRRRRRDGPAAE